MQTTSAAGYSVSNGRQPRRHFVWWQKCNWLLETPSSQHRAQIKFYKYLQSGQTDAPSSQKNCMAVHNHLLRNSACFFEAAGEKRAERKELAQVLVYVWPCPESCWKPFVWSSQGSSSVLRLALAQLGGTAERAKHALEGRMYNPPVCRLGVVP